MPPGAAARAATHRVRHLARANQISYRPSAGLRVGLLLLLDRGLLDCCAPGRAVIALPELARR
jgi:hypothetical protein